MGYELLARVGGVGWRSDLRWGSRMIDGGVEPAALKGRPLQGVMRVIDGKIRLAATDLGNHLACRHVTTLDLLVARGEKSAPQWAAPDLKVIQELGLRHEAAYLEHLAGLDAPGGRRKLEVVNLGGIKDDARLLAETSALMERGVDVIAQGALGGGEWFGRPDVLRRVEGPGGGKWAWSYEVADTKLARETKAPTIL
jgi:hypothetical protein